MFLQHLIVLAIVAVCLAVVVRGALRTLRQQQGGLGKCCEKGCAPVSTPAQIESKPQVVFIPVGQLRKKKT